MVEIDPNGHLHDPDEKDPTDEVAYYAFIGLVTVLGLAYLGYVVSEFHAFFTAGVEPSFAAILPLFALCLVTAIVVGLAILTTIGMATHNTYHRVATGLERWR